MHHRMLFFLLFVSLVFDLASCTTAAPVLSLSKMEKVSLAEAGAIFSVRFADRHTFIGESGCNLAVVRTDKFLQPLKEIHFDPGTAAFFVELAPGTYAYREIRCGRYSADLSFSKIPVFHVFEQKVSVIGTVQVLLTQNEAFQIGIFPNNQKTARDIENDLGSSWTHSTRLVSGYSGQVLR